MSIKPMKYFMFTLILLIFNLLSYPQNRPAKFGYLKLDLDEKDVLRESETDQNYIFGNIFEISINSVGDIYLLDIGLKRIIRYNKEGKFIQNIGKVGQGPGEFIFPLKIFTDERDNIYVNDRGRTIIVYDRDGNFQRFYRAKKTIGDFYVDRDGYIYSFTHDFSGSGVVKVLVKMDKEGNIIKKFAEFLETDVKVRTNGRGVVMGGVKHPYSFDSFFCYLPDNLLCYGENSKYRLLIYDLEGNLKNEISKEEKAQPITGEERKRISIKKDIVIPSYRPFFSGILSDEKGRIWVIRTKSVLEKGKEQVLDIFSKDGNYLYQVELPYLPKIIRNGNIWVIHRDKEDRTVIKRLKIKNYSSMKY